MFEVDEKIVYPPYGVGKIEAIENKEIAGQKMNCYILHIPGKHLKIIVPVFNARKVGLRQIIKAEDIEKVLHILQQEMDNMPAKWTKRCSLNREKIRTGSIYEIAEVFKNLTRLEKTRDLSMNEKRMLESSRELLVSEIAHSKKIGTTQAESLIDKFCCRS
jgi:CarD family transcriptional regulator